MKKLPILIASVLMLASVTAFAATTYFTDESTFASWFAPSARKMYNHDVIRGFPDGSFGANSFTTRAELAVILDRFAEKVVGKTLREEPLVCTLEARAGVIIYLRNTSGATLRAATFMVNDKPSTDITEQSAGSGTYVGLYEKTGYQTIKISRAGYRDHIETIKLEKDNCHVIPQSRTITLVAS